MVVLGRVDGIKLFGCVSKIMLIFLLQKNRSFDFGLWGSGNLDTLLQKKRVGDSRCSLKIVELKIDAWNTPNWCFTLTF